jgi:hypothetical protein
MVGHGSAVVAGCGKAARASIGAKGGSYHSLVAMGEANDSMMATKGHGGVRTMARHVASSGELTAMAN